MRHLGSILLALLLAPATWVLTGVGVGRFTEARVDPAGLTADLAVGLAAVVGAGLCYALLVLPRLSPLGLVLAGLAFLGLVGWRAVDLDGFDRVISADSLDVTLALRRPADDYAALLALPLLGTVFSVRRWRRHDQPPAGYATEYPTAEYPPQPYQPGDEETWPFPTGTGTTDTETTDTETTRRL